MRLPQVLGLAAAALAAFYLGELLYHGLHSAFYPYDLNYGEGYVLNDALRLVRGEPVWGDINQFPMVRSPYPPLYLLVTGLLAAPWPSFLGPRLVSFVSTLTIGALLFWHGRRASRFSSRAWLPGAVAAGLWFGSTFVYQWAPLARVDMLGLALGLGAVLLVERVYAPPRPDTAKRDGPAPLSAPMGEVEGARGGNSGPRVRHTDLLLAAALCSLALLTKQTNIAAPLAITIYLALRRDVRALWFAGLVITVVVGITLALNMASAGQYAQHVLFGNAANPYHVGRAGEMIGLFLPINALAIVGAGWAILLHWARLRPTPIGVYIPLAVATVLTAGNTSSDVNYFLEPTLALALAAPLALRAAESGIPRGSLLGPGLALAQLALLVHFPNGWMVHYPPGPAKGSTPVAEDVRVGNRVEAIVRSAESSALVELAGFAVLAGAPVWIQPIDLQAEARQGRWTPDLLSASFAERRWSTVVLSYKLLPPDSMAAFERGYEQTDGLASPNGFSYFVYKPRPGGATALGPARS